MSMVLSKSQPGTYVQTEFPQQLVIEVTAACNQNCIFCGRTYMARAKKTMKRAMFDRIVEEVARENPMTEIWPAFMGEAFLLGNRLFDMLEYARQVGCEKITINTNGTRIDEKTIPRILNCGIDRLIVSCDAHTPETHRKVRPSRQRASGLEKIYRGVEVLIDRMEKAGQNTPIIEMQFSTFDENEHEAETFTQYWLDRGVVVKVRPKLYWTGLFEGGKSSVTTSRARRTPCLWSMDTAAIHWNGNIVTCAVDAEGKHVVGNVETLSVKGAWEGPLAGLRQLQIERHFDALPEICRSCPDWQVKRAKAYFPNPAIQARYETYVRKGRLRMEAHEVQ